MMIDSRDLDDIGTMAIPKFRTPLPEDRLLEEERKDRASALEKFAKKLRTERKTASLDDRSHIRDLLVYVKKRLRLLDLEDKHARGLERYDFLLGYTTKPVPQGLLGVAAGATLDLGLKDTERVIRRHESRTESLIKEISISARRIDKLLDQRPCRDEEDYVLRPSSCLPELAITDDSASSKSGDTPELQKTEDPKSDEAETDVASESQVAEFQSAKEDGSGDAAPAEVGHDKVRPDSSSGKASKSTPKSTISDEVLRKKFLESKRPIIEVFGNRYSRHFIVNRMADLKYLTIRQRVAAVLGFGYDMEDSAIAKLMGIARRTVYDHLRAAESGIAKDPSMELFLKSYKRKKRINKEEDTSGSE